MEYNGTSPTGGNSADEDLNVYYNLGDIAFVLVSASMVFIMIPGLGFLYSGLARRKSALSMIWACMMSGAVAIFTWYFWAYSLAFSHTATNGYIGNLHAFGLRNVLGAPPAATPLVPELLYSLYQGMFCGVTLAIIMGSIAERGRLLPAMLFTFIFATIVYAPIACWAWNVNGWAFKWGVFDWAGGGPVEIGSGFGGLAYSFVLGRRSDKLLLNFRPHNVSLVTLGTIFLWFGWLGFNGASSFGANLRSVYASWNSNLTAIFGGASWCLMDYRLERKWSTVAICSGFISGLVAATPASGFIPLWASVALGVVSGITCNLATKLKFLLRIDDSLDIFAEHAVAGIIGLIWNGFFAADYVIGLDGVNLGVTGGWVNHNYAALYKQLVYVLACSAYTFVVTCIICYGLNKIPGLQLRADEDAEMRGMDEDQIGEFAYDYVEVRRDYLAWSHPTTTDGVPIEHYKNQPTLMPARPYSTSESTEHGSGSGEKETN
ncbi:ammonium transporter AmtB-like domain-containing protein [Lipomyces chichibuensis]|uniref:ammonium transporter AmtB-like domain-containing protein n=1 Tax=Lipomyces chichibuensis TaxID=1546026 RepID=UPI0033434559